MCVVAPISTIHVFGFEEDKEKICGSFRQTIPKRIPIDFVAAVYNMSEEVTVGLKVHEEFGRFLGDSFASISHEDLAKFCMIQDLSIFLVGHGRSPLMNLILFFTKCGGNRDWYIAQELLDLEERSVPELKKNSAGSRWGCLVGSQRKFLMGLSSGHYALVTQQPLRGMAKQSGQRVGEIEVWALEGFSVAHILQEMLTYKSDHIRARQEVLGTTIIGGTIPKLEDTPESLRLLVRELRSLALQLNHFCVSEELPD
ncbi:RNA polymerase beta subunit [Cucumis melo var. makuwa]|uniref:DNA-directed RNA polymerase n=1 Tax=Cucumis melo var. makuwa TaxID=1194695 RepID=A0A5D3BYI0_CUCMM|nr:RNA polymerase beta subunit [Cucumis melo var. makuwa]TYK04741.1 RNA polymerase beta subunit [Cucumis melo var. makuwa]